jgi:hypothetical protein
MSIKLITQNLEEPKVFTKGMDICTRISNTQFKYRLRLMGAERLELSRAYKAQRILSP